MVKLSGPEWIGLLDAWRILRASGWTGLEKTTQPLSGVRDPEKLEKEVKRQLAEMNADTCQVRVFWKRSPGFQYLGCNDAFARDGGFERGSDLDGLDDFDRRLAWSPQSAKYRADDERVVASATPVLDLLERQNRADGVHYLRTSKAPLMTLTGCFGIIGMYETIDEATARRLFQSQVKR